MEVVNYEGPIRKDEAWRRVIEYWGMRSLGKRIREIARSIERYCIKNGMIEKRGVFYWPVNMKKPPVRRRDSKNVSNDVELILPGVLFISSKEKSQLFLSFESCCELILSKDVEYSNSLATS